MSQETVEVEVVGRFLDALLRGDLEGVLTEADPALEVELALFVMCVTGKGSGIELDRRDAATFRVQGGKVAEIAYYNDQRQALEAVGLAE